MKLEKSLEYIPSVSFGFDFLSTGYERRVKLVFILYNQRTLYIFCFLHLSRCGLKIQTRMNRRRASIT